MKKYLVLVLLLSIQQSFSQNVTRYVDPFIGTSGNGHTFPGATTPFGMVQLSPQTGNFQWSHCSGYQYNDVEIQGFGHTYLNGTGIADLGDVLVFPFSDDTTTIFKSRYSKTTEKASPGYYSVQLTNSNVQVQLTATEHTGYHKYSFGNDRKGHLLINIDNTLFSWGDPTKSKVTDAAYTIENDSTISGYLKSSFWAKDRNVFFVIHLSKAFVNKRFIDNKQRKLVLDFDLSKSKEVEMKVAISTVSVAGAKANYAAELAGKSYKQIQLLADKKWNRYLSKVQIEGTDVQKTNLYTALYHCFIQPNNIADVDGKYTGADGKVYTSPTKSYYSTLSLWDTYRAAHPLYTILIPKENSAFLKSMMAHYDAKGELPIWTLWGKENYCMIANHSVPVLVDAYLKGISGIDGNKMMDAIKKTLTINDPKLNFKVDWKIYNQHGFYPSDKMKTEAASKTLECSYDDWCAAQLAKKLGRKADYQFFNNRSMFYKNLYDKSNGLMRGRNSDSSWVTPFNKLKISHAGSAGGDYTEGNAWQYTWQVQHDVKGLISLMGNKQQFAAKLDTLFSLPSTIEGEGNTDDVSGLIGQYAHGNEPCHHVIYLYNYAGKPHKTQELIPEVLSTQYTNTPDGLSGNDDCGQMSAWYIFSSLGFYPVNPASGIFDISVPAYKSASLKVGEKVFVIQAPKLSKENKYIQSIKLNGKPINTYTISYKQIMAGGVLEFEMGDKIKIAEI